MKNKFKHFHITSSVTLMLLGFIIVVLIGLIDYHVPFYLSFSIFYLVPVYLSTWFVGQEAGILISIISAFIWVLINFLKQPDNLPVFVYLWNTGVRLGFFLITTYLLSELNNSLKREKILARTDYITGVANSRLFFEWAELEIQRANQSKYSLTIVYIDVDNFKQVNDNFGHLTGDLLLKKVAETMKNYLRATDMIARIGGDEFVLLFPKTEYEPAHFLLSRLHHALLETMEEYQWPATFSIGAVTFLTAPASVEEMIEKADNLMYVVKQKGKNMIKHERFGFSNTAN